MDDHIDYRGTLSPIVLWFVNGPIEVHCLVVCGRSYGGAFSLVSENRNCRLLVIILEDSGGQKDWHGPRWS